ncbi:ABC transporter ATP-binding protein [Chakrabartyella piscis]|uniref:ABC transporter ATP-binding protein n=1 Tax=Chakrabartyella piscis TaxID=2918914 RepID=UPI0029586E9E|nr:ABC transporter ATP-binding protein [Chakrabartyella piscis]
MLEIKNLTFGYDGNVVLDEISYTANKGDFVSVLGLNGAGKSTLLKCILGCNQKYTGQILIDGRDIRGLSCEKMAEYIAYIPQNHVPSFSYTVFEMVLMGTNRMVAKFASPTKKQYQIAEKALETIGITHLSNRDYQKLSGGERQLCLLARAIAQQSPILLLDEPCTGLDFGNQMKVLEKLKELAEMGLIVMQTTHNPEHSYLFSNKIIAISKGKPLFVGSPKEIITTEHMKRLYGIPLRVYSLEEDRFRTCVPEENRMLVSV